MQYAEAVNITTRIVQIGIEMGKKGISSYTQLDRHGFYPRLCDIKEEWNDHRKKYGVNDIMAPGQGACSTQHGMYDALGGRAVLNGERVMGAFTFEGDVQRNTSIHGAVESLLLSIGCPE